MGKIIDMKFKDADFVGKLVSELPDDPSEAGFSAEKLKGYFDALPKALIALQKLNPFFDLLESAEASGSIGALLTNGTASNLQAALHELKTISDNKDANLSELAGIGRSTETVVGAYQKVVDHANELLTQAGASKIGVKKLYADDISGNTVYDKLVKLAQMVVEIDKFTPRGIISNQSGLPQTGNAYGDFFYIRTADSQVFEEWVWINPPQWQYYGNVSLHILSSKADKDLLNVTNSAFKSKAEGAQISAGKIVFNNTGTPIKAIDVESALREVNTTVTEVRTNATLALSTITMQGITPGTVVTATCRTTTMTATCAAGKTEVKFLNIFRGAWSVASGGQTGECVITGVGDYVVRRYTYLFGFDLNIADSNPATRITYPSDVDNAGFVPALMNFSTNVFSYGSWSSTPGEKFMPKPCMITYGGIVDHYLNPNDYTKKTDGTPSRISDTSFGGNAMIEWPKIYVKRWMDGNTYKFRCCDIKIEPDYECWCNYDRLNNEIGHFYTPIYFGSNISGKLRSISDQSNFVSNTADTEITYAKANGNDWHTEVLADRLLIQDLLVMMAKTTECQTTYGYGRCLGSNSSAIGQGTMNAKGMFWGDDDQTSGVKVFGMENWWGNIWRRTAGWILENGTQKVKLTRGTKDGSTATDYNTTGSGYKNISGATPSGTSGGYISSMKTEVFGRIPVAASGSATTFECDGLWFNNSGVMYAIVGGSWANALLVGPFCANLDNAASYSATSVGAALSCKPLA